jgi:hypothetical protein
MPAPPVRSDSEPVTVTGAVPSLVPDGIVTVRVSAPALVALPVATWVPPILIV